MSARWSVTQVLTAMGFGRWTHRDTVHCCIISRVTLHSLAPRSSDRSFKHLLSCFVRDLFIYCSISVVEPRVTEQRVTNWWKLSQVYHNVWTESLWTFVFPPRHHVKPNTVLLYHSESWAFCYQSSCSFVLLPQCESAKAALGFIWRNGTPSSAQCVLFFVCVHVVPALCQSVYILALTAFCFALSVSSQPCLPLSSIWTLFLPSRFTCCSALFLQGAY